MPYDSPTGTAIRRGWHQVLRKGHAYVDPCALDRWNPKLIRAITVALDPVYRYYFRAHAEGMENIPKGPFILVGVHGGGILSPDLVLMAKAFYEHTQFTRPLFGLGHRMLFEAPYWNRFLMQLGGVEGHRKVARRILEAGHAFMVFPGGEWDVTRPWRERNRVDFAGRTGFVRLAVETGVPLLPVGAVGGQGTWVVLSRGRPIARRIGLEKLFGVHNFPIVVSLPWGLSLGYLPFLPLPARLGVKFGTPLFTEQGPEAAADRAYLAWERDRAQKAVADLVTDLAGCRGQG